MKRLVLIGSAALLLAACGGGESVAQNGASNVVRAGGKGEISENRTTAFKSFMPTFSKMRKMANGDEAFTPEAFQAAAATFVKEAREPFEYFQNDPNGNGDALPVIWQKQAEFQAEQDKFLAAVDKLNEVAQTGKLDDIKVVFNEVGASCKSCHDVYRRPK